MRVLRVANGNVWTVGGGLFVTYRRCTGPKGEGYMQIN